MTVNHLPFAMAMTYKALSIEPNVQQKTRLLQEIEAVSVLIGEAKKGHLLVPAILQDYQSDFGVTVASDEVCPCCLRPFPKKGT